ncbi:MAG: oligoendopeptidase F [Lachnospiraceae bacterium]|nr:oligoendopeptidase F [Ruminococcus sp.]MCM1275015.1 oligoendopeptidase F [Lachnospiraceae bacterium]
MPERIPQRADVSAENKWAIEDIYATDGAWEADFKRAAGYAEKIGSYKGELSTSADKLLEYFKMDDELTIVFDSLINYAQRRSDEDTRVAKYQDMTNRLEMLYVQIAGAAAFVTPEILSISDGAMESFFKACPELELYRRSLERIRRQRGHILSEAEERIMALTGEMQGAPDTIFSMFNDADLKFPDAVDSGGNAHQITHESYVPLMQSPDRALRKSAFEAMYHTYGSFKNTSAAMLSSQVKTLVFRARARNYGSTLEAALDGNEVDTAVYRRLIEAVHENMGLMHRYVKLRKRALGVDELHAYDLYTPIVGGVEDKVPFERAKEEVYESLAPLGEEYRAIFREGIEKRWIDVCENEGKRSGAYSAGAKVHPFVLLNYKNTLNWEFTLAHEMGHAIHSYLSNKHQPTAYADYVIFVAEVASTCNESLLMQHLLKNTDDKKRRAFLVNYFLEQFRTTLYRQTMFAEFELMINEKVENGESLTAESLCEMYHKLNVDYYGGELVVDPELDMEWARIPHFYYNYYVYQYATGFSAAIALSQRILNEGESAVKDYIGFLSGGCSKDPISLLKGAGVDMTSKKAVEDALKLFSSLLDEMEELLA